VPELAGEDARATTVSPFLSSQPFFKENLMRQPCEDAAAKLPKTFLNSTEQNAARNPK
jgi:hypothetical protein